MEPLWTGYFKVDISEDLLNIAWPNVFVVVYRDGTSERLLRGNGVHVSSPIDDPEGIGSFSAELPKKHRANQKQCLRYVSFVDLDRILDESGQELFYNQH